MIRNNSLRNALISLFSLLGAFSHVHASPTESASRDFHWYLHETASSSPLSGNCDLLKKGGTNCFLARTAPVVRVFLMQYGDYSTVTDLKRIGSLLAKRFFESTEGALQLEFVDHVMIPFPNYKRDFSNFIKDVKGDQSLDRLTRLWYLYNKDVDKKDTLLEEIRKELINRGYSQTLEKTDAILVLSAAQFEGLGYATGGYAITEQPGENAWSLPDGETIYYSDAKIVDELLHELGHVLGLDHAAKQCMDEPTSEKMHECCLNSPSGDDVMSYCRARGKVDDDFYFRYSKCSLDFLKNVTAPALMTGGQRPFQPSACQ